MTRTTITLRDRNGDAIFTCEGKAIELWGIPLVLHRATAGVYPDIVLQKSGWHVSEPTTGTKVWGDGGTQAQTIEETRKKVEAIGGGDRVRRAMAETLMRYAQIAKRTTT